MGSGSRSGAAGSRSTDAGLLFLRVVAGTSLLLKHGLEKLEHFTAMAQHFPNPLHIGPLPSLLFALVSDFVCSMLIVVGVGTRWAAAVAFVNIFVAWALVHHFLFFGRGADHGELIVLYLAAFGCLILSGGGRYSLDTMRQRRS
ncbi:MAG: DoxX family protein [Acidobacteriota bacterium]